LETQAAAWRGVAACLCTTLLGLGLARFAYTPLIPALITAHWFTPGQAVYLGAANIAGYLAGATTARRAAHVCGVRVALRAGMILATITLLACAWPGGFAWFLLWRFISGLAGAYLVVLASPSVLPLLHARHRGLAGGVIFLGIGLGIVVSSTILPSLLRIGLPQAWLGLGAGGAILTVLAWPFLPRDAAAPKAAPGLRFKATRQLGMLCAAYAATAIGQVPAILFLADYLARGLNHGVASGARIWMVFGVGALAGPLIAGAVADKIGFVAALRGLWMLNVIACAGLALSASMAVIDMSSAIIGAGVPGAVVLVLGRSQMLCPPDPESRRAAWSLATACYALGQVFGAYGISYAFAGGGNYGMLFATGAVFMAVAFAAGEISSFSLSSGPRNT